VRPARKTFRAVPGILARRWTRPLSGRGEGACRVGRTAAEPCVRHTCGSAYLFGLAGSSACRHPGERGQPGPL